MLFYSFFRELVERQALVTVELKDDLRITGNLQAADQFLNVTLANVTVSDPERYAHLLSIKNCFIRGPVVRYIHLPASEVDTDALQDHCRQEAKQISGR
mmetsp:Transcript_22277/g.63729  ORF Transcript_22277/g.63729 Transcript_22277/m.63729 type:complete len:99 (-) Transcript_22277:27-323(-)